MKFLVARMSGVGRNFAQLRQARLPWWLLLLLLTIQTWVEACGGYRSVPWWYVTFGLTREDFLHGKLWQVFSYAFLHGSWPHAVANVGCLLMLGTRIEHYLGGRTLLKILGIGVLGGGVGHLVLAAGGENAGPLVGSSAACFSLLILITTLSPDSRMWPLPVSGRNLGLGLLSSFAALALLDPALGVPGISRIGEWMSRQGLAGWWSIGHACHLGGGLAGWLYGRWMLRPRVSLVRLRRERARREADAKIG
jgi:membrane associated rhomboid family serine protease